MKVSQVPGSFRDPRGTVLSDGSKIYREIKSGAVEDYKAFVASGLYASLVANGRFVRSEPCFADGFANESVVVEHERIPFVSYPYEWSFSQLKNAALLHLNIHLEALKSGFTLTDASAFNVQFIGADPIFIDLLSFSRYEDGVPWAGRQQFCEHFLHPLLLSGAGTPFNSWLRGSLEGIRGEEILRLLPLRNLISLKIFFNIWLPLRLHTYVKRNHEARERALKSRITKPVFEYLIKDMRDWILSIQPNRSRTTWGHYYEDSANYSQSEFDAKRRIVTQFVSTVRPNTVWDLGCNTGEFSEVAVKAGAKYVVSFDNDQSALEAAYRRAQSRLLPIISLYQDMANPSPDQGWEGLERQSLQRRANADALLVLALEHHLAVGRNIPLKRLVAWLVTLAPVGLIEFIPPNDSNFKLLFNKPNSLVDGHTETEFRNAIEVVAAIERVDVVSASGRKLFWYRRKS
jgi:ribosomal protein L11 methylase PrmA